VRGLSIVAVCALAGCQFRVGAGEAPDPPADGSPIVEDLAVPADLAMLPDLTPPPDLIPPSELVVTVAPLSGAVDLTQLGTLDWAHYGFSGITSFDDKATGNQRISTLTVLPNSSAQAQFGSSALSFSWSDGTTGTGQQPTATNSTTDVYVTSGGQSLHAPAGVEPRRLIVYATLLSVHGQFQATLSDGSQPMYTNTQTPTDSNDHGFAYTIDYQARSPGQTLTVTWSVVAGTSGGGAGFGGAALTKPPAPPTPPMK
jgi:hypothetical protein